MDTAESPSAVNLLQADIRSSNEQLLVYVQTLDGPLRSNKDSAQVTVTPNVTLRGARLLS
jgi:hypothetical protein